MQCRVVSSGDELNLLASGECLDDEDFGIGGNAVGEGPLVAQELVADEDIDVLAQGALLIDDVVAQPAPALVDGGDDVGDGGGVDLCTRGGRGRSV